MYSTHTTVVCRLIKTTILMLFLFNVKCSQIFHLHFYVHMYFRKSVRIAKIHLQCSGCSGVWENIKEGLHIQVPTIKISSEKCDQKCWDWQHQKKSSQRYFTSVEEQRCSVMCSRHPILRLRIARSKKMGLCTMSSRWVLWRICHVGGNWSTVWMVENSS